MGRCNHIIHQKQDEATQDFVERARKAETRKTATQRVDEFKHKTLNWIFNGRMGLEGSDRVTENR